MNKWFDEIEPLQRNSSVSIQDQLYNFVKEWISSGVLQIDDKLPSESELCSKFDISRMSVRLALIRLTQEGYIVRRAGKGSYVSAPKYYESGTILYGFTEKMEKQGFSVWTKVLSLREVDPTNQVMRALMLHGDEKVYEISRIRYVDDEPLVYQTVHLPKKYFENLHEQDLTQSLTNIITTRYMISMTRCKEELIPGTAGDYEAKLLNIEPKSLIMRIEGVSYTDANEPIRYSAGMYRSNRMRFIFTSNKQLDIERLNYDAY